jgi:hypothetical protein
MWRALDAMALLAAGEPSFGAPLGQVARGTSYAPQSWAPDFAAVADAKGAKVSASFTSSTLSVAAIVTLIQRA